MNHVTFDGINWLQYIGLSILGTFIGLCIFKIIEMHIND